MTAPTSAYSENKLIQTVYKVLVIRVVGRRFTGIPFRRTVHVCGKWYEEVMRVCFIVAVRGSAVNSAVLVGCGPTRSRDAGGLFGAAHLGARVEKRQEARDIPPHPNRVSSKGISFLKFKDIWSGM
jgi:hypothetical protein